MRKLTKASLQDILRTSLGLKDAEFRLRSSGGRWSGSVISPTFKGQRDHQRQKGIWDALDAELGPDSVKNVGMLLAYTPDEWNIDLTPTTRPRRAKAG